MTAPKSMQQRHSRVFVLLAVALPAAGAWACSEDEPAHAFVENDAGREQTIDATSEAGIEDAGSPSRPTVDASDEAVVCTNTPCAVELVAGENHFCTRMNDGTVRCWGDPTDGALGDANEADDNHDAGGVPFRVGTVTGLTDVEQLSAGGTTTCAKLTDGSLRCWGGNGSGQLGLQVDPPISDTDAHPSPSPVAMTTPAKRVDVGPQTVCAIARTGETWCWGNNMNGQAGRSVATVAGPTVNPLEGMALDRTWHGSFTSFGRTTQGEIVSWGAVAGPSASVAARSASMSPDPAPLPIGLSGVTDFSVSSTTPYIAPGEWQPSAYLAHACAIANGQVWCWGESQSAALATGLPDKTAEPMSAHVSGANAYPQRVTAAGETTCVRLTDGTLQCAGDNSRGALGIGADAGAKFSPAFTAVTEFEGHAVQVVASASAVCALVQGGSVVCWGANERGELGQGTKDLKSHPSPIPVSF